MSKKKAKYKVNIIKKGSPAVCVNKEQKKEEKKT